MIEPLSRLNVVVRFLGVLVFCSLLNRDFVAADDLSNFLAHFDDPESASISPSLREVSRSIVSMGHGDGFFSIPLSQEFLARKIGSGSELTTMQNFLSNHFGSFWWKSGEDVKYLQVTPGFDFVISKLKKFSAANSNGGWNKGPGEDSIPDKRSLPGAGNCSGFLVGSHYVITNNHCISTQEKCDYVSFRFNEELDNDLKTLKPIDAYACKRIVITDRSLDFSLIELNGNPVSKWSSLKLAVRDPIAPHREWKSDFLCIGHWISIPGESLYLIGHPAVHPPYLGGNSFKTIKKISKVCRVTNGVSKISLGWDPHFNFPYFDWDELLNNSKFIPKEQETTEFSVDCSAAGGNSGSPVLDEHFNVIGLFNLGGEGSKNLNGGSAIPISRIYKKYKHIIEDLGIAATEF